VAPDHPSIKETADMILRDEKGRDGGIRPIGSVQVSDVCINGMFLNYACYFRKTSLNRWSISSFPRSCPTEVSTAA
jgi:hypothetical protein